MTGKGILSFIIASCFLLSIGRPAASDDTARQIEQPIRQSIDTRQATQEAEAQWRLDKEELTDQFDQLQDERDRLQQQAEELQQHVASTRTRIAAKEKQLADIEQISSQIQPFLDETLSTLKDRVSTGQPFLLEERRKRIESLDRLMSDPEVSISERYRKTMEALMVEAEYGFTVETYQETIPIDGQTLLADIFRLGRLSLFYQSLDRRQCGFYNVVSRTWQPLPASHNPSIQAAIDIAAKRQPVELLSLPLGRLVSR